jgi:transcriptional regulator with XRE-family HTH domain
MSIGEKIARYRKKAELSQEELGQQLFVTRQTVSQWENDQTVPTLENFMRLCEIFKLTMNDFFEQNVCAEKSSPTEVEERYVFEYSASDIDKALVMLTKERFAWSLYGAFFMVLVIVTASSNTAVALGWVYLIINLLRIVGLVIGFVRERVKIRSRMSAEKYVYEVINGGICCTVYSSYGELRLYERIDMTCIEKTWNSRDLYIFQHKQRRYIIIKDQITADSKFKHLLGF